MNGFRAHRGHVMEDGMDTRSLISLKRFILDTFTQDLIMEKYIILGNPYEMYWNDVNDKEDSIFLIRKPLLISQLTILINYFITYIMKILIINCLMRLNIRIKL